MGGIIYLLTNEAMPGYVKIGKTNTSIEQRMGELSRSSSVPLPFECHYAARVADMTKVEQALHDAFDDYRVNPRREFFNVVPERVVAILKVLAIEEITPPKGAGVETKEDEVALEAARKRRSAFNFGMVDIPAGAELTFSRDESVTCKVSSDGKHIEFQGKKMSLSAAAQIALDIERPIQGPLYWVYEGETLEARRIRMQEGNE